MKTPSIFTNQTLEVLPPFQNRHSSWEARKSFPKVNLQIDLPREDWDDRMGNQHLDGLKKMVMMDDRLFAMEGEVYDNRAKYHIDAIVADRFRELRMTGLIVDWGNGKSHFDLRQAAEIYPELKDSWPKAEVRKAPGREFKYSFYEAGVLIGFGDSQTGPILAGPDETLTNCPLYVDIVSIDESALEK